jgi:hypothetical protein
MSSNGGSQSVEAGTAVDESSSTPADGGKRSDAHQQLV